jgi:uncharacterized cupredoxin-like copper-binding protein
MDRRVLGTQLLRSLVLCALAAGTIVLAACGGTSQAAETSGPSVVVRGLDTMRFEPDTVTVKAGQPVTIVFRNAGLLPHDLITTGADRNVRLVNVGAGKEQRGTFLATKPGTYEMVCNQPGHKEAGMVGKIIVG